MKATSDRVAFAFRHYDSFRSDQFQIIILLIMSAYRQQFALNNGSVYLKLAGILFPPIKKQ